MLPQEEPEEEIAMTYRAPVKDIAFCLEQIAGLAGLEETGAFPELSSDLTAALLEGAGALMSDVLAPLNHPGDMAGAKHHGDGSVTSAPGFKAAYEQWVEGAWGSICFDPEFGGMGLPRSLQLAVQEMAQGANMAWSLLPMLSQGSIEVLTAHGTDEQKQTYLAKIISGTWAGTMNLTEPQAGSDVGALRAKAVSNGDGSYAITGTKIFITWGEHDCAENIIHLVLARLPGAPEGTKGISLFLVPKFLVNEDGSLGAQNDVTCASIEHKLGIHGSPTCVMAFGEKGGATGYLIGEENRGMRLMFTMMNNARLSVGLQGVGIAEAATQMAVSYAQERRQGQAVGAPSKDSVPIIQHADVRRMLMTMRAYTEASRAICYETAMATDYAHAHPEKEAREDYKKLEELLTPIAKAWSTDKGVEVASLGVQVHGGMGYIEETGAAQFFRDARIAPIYEGTNGIQAIDLVTRKLSLDGGDVMAHWIVGAQELAAELALQEDEDLVAIGKELGRATKQLGKVTGWMMDRMKESPNDALAGATPYLELFGIVAGGTYLARGAIAAVDGLAENPGDGFLKQKLSVAAFYAANILPLGRGLKATICQGASGLYELDADEFSTAL